MSNPRTPDLLTTHTYIVEATELLGETTQHDVRHLVATAPIEPTADIPVPHVFEASLTVPVGAEDPDTGQLSFYGPRMLKVELLTDVMPRRREHTPGSSVRTRLGETETEQRVLAQTTFKFNTKRLLDVFGNVWYDGENLGIGQEAATDGTNRNFLLRYFAELAGKRSLGVPRAAEFVTDVSLSAAQSVERIRSNVDISKFAQQISRASGLAIPTSLRHVPHVSYAGDIQVRGAEVTPTIATYKYTVDDYSFNRKDNRRVISDWLVTQHNGLTPVNPQYLGFYHVDQLSGEPTGASFGIDAKQDAFAFTDDGVNEQNQYAETVAEARQMMAPYINAVTSLRRYYNAARRQTV